MTYRLPSLDNETNRRGGGLDGCDTRKILQPGIAGPVGRAAASCPDEGRHFQAVLEDAMQEYLDSKARGKVRPEVMAHFRASLERNRRLGELLAKS